MLMKRLLLYKLLLKRLLMKRLLLKRLLLYSLLLNRLLLLLKRLINLTYIEAFETNSSQKLLRNFIFLFC